MTRPKPAPPSTPDDTEGQFYEALQRGDIERLMAVWSEDEEISCVHPGGPRLVGAAAIRASFEVMFGNGAIDARPDQIRRVQTHACAVHSVLEQVRVGSPEGVQLAWVVATNVYVKTAQGWRLVAHHASPGSATAVQDVIEATPILH